MKLPNGERAFVDIVKLRDYSLDPSHPEGKHKARVFASALGLTRDDADWLRAQLLAAARAHDCQLGRKTGHGQRYSIDFVLMRHDRSARVRSAWNVRLNEDSLDWSPATCYKTNVQNTPVKMLDTVALLE